MQRLGRPPTFHAPYRRARVRWQHTAMHHPQHRCLTIEVIWSRSGVSSDSVYRDEQIESHSELQREEVTRRTASSEMIWEAAAARPRVFNASKACPASKQKIITRGVEYPEGM